MSDGLVNLDAALAHRESGRYAEAAAVLQRVLAADARDAAAWAHLAHVLTLLRQDEQGAAALNQALALDASLPVVQRNLARLLLRRQQPAQALQAAHAAWQAGPADAESMLVLAAPLGAAGDAAKAAAITDEVLRLHPGYAEAYAMRAQRRARGGDLAGALQDADAALAVKPHLGNVAALRATLRYQAGDLPGAMASLQGSVDIDPRNAEYIAMLGEFKRQDRQVEAAITLLETAVALAPAHAAAWTNLGAALQQAGQAERARLAYEKALAINPQLSEAANNLGLLALERKDAAAAVRLFHQAVQARPGFARAHANLADALLRSGLLPEAEAAYRQAVASDATLADVWLQLGDTLRLRGALAEAAVAYRQAMALEPAGAGLRAAVWLAAERYLADDLAACSNLMVTAEPITKKPGNSYFEQRNYWLYLVELGSWRERHGWIAPAVEGEVLHVIGESHCFSAHSNILSWRGRSLRGRAQWIPGCKQWHLGNGQPNQYKAAFAAAANRLPPGSDVLVTVGEIDCRLREGMLAAWRKSGQGTLAQMAQATAAGFIRYVGETMRPLGHRVMISGVPAIKQSLAQREGMDDELVALVREFNRVLASLALEAGMDFLDVYALTDRGDGLASGQWHLDDYHLQPGAVDEAFRRHCRLAG